VPGRSSLGLSSHSLIFKEAIAYELYISLSTVSKGRSGGGGGARVGGSGGSSGAISSGNGGGGSAGGGSGVVNVREPVALGVLAVLVVPTAPMDWEALVGRAQVAGEIAPQ
jgi:hypothetical protein